MRSKQRVFMVCCLFFVTVDTLELWMVHQGEMIYGRVYGRGGCFVRPSVCEVSNTISIGSHRL